VEGHNLCKQQEGPYDMEYPKVCRSGIRDLGVSHLFPTRTSTDGRHDGRKF